MRLRSFLRRQVSDLGLPVPGALLGDDARFVRGVAESLDRSDVVIDLGAHVGIASIEFAHRAGAVHAFEPHPATFAQLAHNVRHYPRIHPVNAAVSDRAGRAALYSRPTAGGQLDEGATLMKHKVGVIYDSAVEVEIVRLSDFVLGLGGPVALVKMDIEGAEYRVIADLIETPAMAQIRQVRVECHVDRIAGLSAARAAVEARIAALGLTNRFDFTWP